jgi:alpha-tubulin suppressor-like RCC1 family protein
LDARLLESLAVLELEGYASIEEARDAYRTLSRVWHPDRFVDSPALAARANARQQQLNAAYRELTAAYRDGRLPLPRPDPVHCAAFESPDPDDPPARTVSGRRAWPAQPRWLVGVLSGAVVVLAAFGAWLAWPPGGPGSGARDVPPSRVMALAAVEACFATGSEVACWLTPGRGLRPWTARHEHARSDMSREIRQLEGGLGHLCALLDDGSVRCWGWNFAGQLGDASLEDRRLSEPSTLRSSARFVRITTLGHHTCGLTGDGTAYCWGNDMDGQLGRGTPSALCRWADLQLYCGDRPAPVRGGPWTDLAAGGSHTCAIHREGGTWCWGSNRYGQLGVEAPRSCDGPDGAWPCSRVPVEVGLRFQAARVVAGASHTCVLDAGGKAHCWGRGDLGQTGRASVDRITPPAPVRGDLAFIALAAGGSHTCGVTRNGALHCWGSNRLRELGTRATNRCLGAPCALEPVLISTGPTTSAIGGFGTTCIRHSGDSVRCWGRGERTVVRVPRSADVLPSTGRAIRRAWNGIRWRLSAVPHFFQRALDPIR